MTEDQAIDLLEEWQESGHQPSPTELAPVAAAVGEGTLIAYGHSMPAPGVGSPAGGAPVSSTPGASPAAEPTLGDAAGGGFNITVGGGGGRQPLTPEAAMLMAHMTNPPPIGASPQEIEAWQQDHEQLQQLAANRVQWDAGFVRDPSGAYVPKDMQDPGYLQQYESYMTQAFDHFSASTGATALGSDPYVYQQKADIENQRIDNVQAARREERLGRQQDLDTGFRGLADARERQTSALDLFRSVASPDLSSVYNDDQYANILRASQALYGISGDPYAQHQSMIGSARPSPVEPITAAAAAKPVGAPMPRPHTYQPQFEQEMPAPQAPRPYRPDYEQEMVR